MTDAPSGPAQAGPLVSVVVPVRNRRELLLACLDGLAEQSYASFEVVVVDDGSTDGSAEAAEVHGAGGRPLRVLRREGGGSGAVAARAAGVDLAVGEILAFTDSDCIPAPDWIERGVAAMEAGPAVVQGRTESVRRRAPLERSLWVGRDDGLFPTCNVFYRRDAFDRAGGFDPAAAEALGFRLGHRAQGLGFGEDTMLGWRVRRAGGAVFAPEVLVRHAVFPPDFHDRMSRTLQAGAFPALVREVPELRRTLLTRGVLLGTSRVPLYAAVLALLSGRWRLAAAAVGVWAGVHFHGMRRNEPSRRRRLEALPAMLAVDAVEAGALVAGSIRARSLVL